MSRLLLLLLLFPLTLKAQTPKLSDQAVISVITCGPGQEQLYTAFGHSAFRVYDPVLGFDAAYNYGVFDFDQPNFYLNFARGYLYYKLGVADFQRFVYPYIYYNRYVHEQVLNLTPEQKQAVFEALQINAKPENANYRYDYFYDNCATKIRDVVGSVLKDSVRFDGAYIKTNYTIRDLTDVYLREQPWGDLGIDICLGLPMDKKATPYEYMFLPDYIEAGFDHASIRSDGRWMPLVREKIVINEIREAESQREWPHPLALFIPFAIVCVGMALRDIRKKKATQLLDIIIFGVTGLIGVLLFFLWFFTDHNAAARNMNILWAFPLNIVAAIAIPRNSPWLKHYFAFVTVLILLTLVLWPVLPQELNLFLIPMIVAIGVRSFTQYWLRKTR